jgi:hypothetical protein
LFAKYEGKRTRGTVRRLFFVTGLCLGCSWVAVSCCKGNACRGHPGVFDGERVNAPPSQPHQHAAPAASLLQPRPRAPPAMCVGMNECVCVLLRYRIAHNPRATRMDVVYVSVGVKCVLFWGESNTRVCGDRGRRTDRTLCMCVCVVNACAQQVSSPLPLRRYCAEAVLEVGGGQKAGKSEIEIQKWPMIHSFFGNLYAAQCACNMFASQYWLQCSHVLVTIYLT